MNKLLNKGKKVYNAQFIFIAVIVALYFCIIFFNTTYKSYYVVGESMEDTLTGSPSGNPNAVGGDYVYIFKAEPRRGDIVVIRVNNNKYIIKRVVALGGDTVELRDGVLYVNDKMVVENYISPENNTPSINNYPKTLVESGRVFCLGDNRNNSKDSRYKEYGAFPKENIVGVVADWSLKFKGAVTAYHTFFEFTLPSLFGK